VSLHILQLEAMLHSTDGGRDASSTGAAMRWWSGDGQFWASNRQHPIQDRDADEQPQCVGPQNRGLAARSDQRFVMAHCRFCGRTLLVAGDQGSSPLERDACHAAVRAGTGESASWAHAARRSSLYGHHQCTSEYVLKRGGDQRLRRRDREDRCSWPSAFGKQEMECGDGRSLAYSLT
jgi:hypothetical protein